MSITELTLYLISILVPSILAIIFYLRSREERLPCYTTFSNKLIENYVSEIDSLKITYAGNKIKNLTITGLLFWNNGRKEIRENDITLNAPLEIRIKNNLKILKAEIIKTNEPANNFKIKQLKDKSYYRLKFDYVGKNQGVFIKILHTGKSEKDIELKGNIIPAGEPKYKPYPEIYSSSFPFFDRKAIVKTGIFLIGFLIFSTTILLLNLHVFHASDSPIYDNPYFVYAFIFLLWFLTWVAIIYIFFKILPEGFEDIAKEFFIEEG